MVRSDGLRPVQVDRHRKHTRYFFFPESESIYGPTSEPIIDGAGKITMSLLSQSEVYDQIVLAQSEKQKIAIATIVTASGSTPQRTGAKLLVFEDGRMLGTVGGGCVEADVWAEAREALIDDRPRLCQFTLRDNPDVPPDEEGMICGGEMEVLIEIWGPQCN